MRNILVTGVTLGLGLAIATRLAADGHRVIGLSRQLSPAYAALMAAHAGQVLFEPLDIADIEAMPARVQAVVKAHGVPFGLVNNAATGRHGVLATMHRKDIDIILRTNLTGPITLTKYVSRQMLGQREGRIVQITSIIARTGFNGLSVYAASKAGLEGFSRSLARELGRAGITVNCVAPGLMTTEMTTGFDDEQMSAIRRRAPLGLAETSDSAAAVSYLLGPDAARVTGTVLTVDGGSTA